MTSPVGDDDFEQLDTAMYRFRAELVDDVAGSQSMMDATRNLYNTMVGWPVRHGFVALDEDFGKPEASDAVDYPSLLDETTNALLTAANDIFALAAQGNLDHYGFEEHDSIRLYRHAGHIVEITLAIRERAITSDWAQEVMARAEQQLTEVKDCLSTATRVRLEPVIDSLKRLHSDIERLYDGLNHTIDAPTT